MAISITCPGCDAALNVAESLVGKTIKCKTCGEMIPVSAPKVAVAKAVPAKAARRSRDDDEFDAPRGAKSGGSKLPLILGAVFGAVLLLGGLAAAAIFALLPSSDVVVKGDPAPTALPSRAPDESRVPPVPDEPKANDPKPTPKEEAPSAKASAPAEPAAPQKGSAEPPKAPDTPVVKPASPAAPPVPTAAVTPPPGVSSEEWNRRMMSGELDATMLDQCKRATVFIDVENKTGGGGSGSGWFGIEQNLVITNAHVLGMMSPNAPPPAKITIYVNSGENGQTPGLLQRAIPHQRIKILAVDREDDIAILEISGEKDLPVPFKVRPTSKVRERQGITVFGFPLGYTPGRITGTKKQPSVSVRPSTATALRYDDFGILRNLQIEGGVNQGNSGGPQTDADGYVIGMTVSGAVRDGVLTQVCFSVPTEQIQGLLAGRIDEVTVETAHNKDGRVNIPIKMTIQDPMKRLKSVGIGYWTGDTSGTIRPPGEIRRGALPSDKDYKEIALTYDSATKTATGMLSVPTLPPGQSYWIQPFYTNTITPKYYLPGTKIDTKGPPVDLVPTNLTVNLRTGPVRPFTLSQTSSRAEVIEGEGGGPGDAPKFTIVMKGTETVIGPDTSDQQNAARLRLKYDDADLSQEIQNQEMKLPPRVLQQIKTGIKALEAFAYVNRSGGIYRTRTNTLGVQDPLIRGIGPPLSNNALEALTVCSIPLPNKEVASGESWNTTRTVLHTVSFIDSLRQSGQEGQPPPGGGRGRPGGPGASGPSVKREFLYTNEAKFTYQGTRTRQGRKEAVIKVEGKVTPAPGQAKDSASGKTTGFAFVDLSTGVVVDAEIESEFELDTSIDGVKRRSFSSNKYNLTRGGSVK
jgi:S1-C subfamily serine protease